MYHIPVFCPNLLCPSIRPSVWPASRVCSVAPKVLVGSISYLYILSSNFRRCVAYKVSWKMSKFEFLAIFLICNFDFVLTWDLMWITSVDNPGASQNEGVLIVLVSNWTTLTKLKWITYQDTTYFITVVLVYSNFYKVFPRHVIKIGLGSDDGLATSLI